MFEFTMLDHLRLTFGHIVYRHKAHTSIAHSRSRLSRWLRSVEAMLAAAILFTALGVAFERGMAYAIACAVLAGIALMLIVVHLALDLDRTAQAHAACASKLWQMREHYRALMSDLVDGSISLDTARSRRDALIGELHAIYENAPPADAQAYQVAAKAILTSEDALLPDEEIDRFLPKSLQKSAKPSPA
jgi:hypothetical protein